MKREINEPNKQSPGNPSEVEEKIRRRAYELYERRGRAEGLELDDWVQAEKEVLNSAERVRAA